MILTADQRLALQMVERKNRHLVDVRLSVAKQVRSELEARLQRETADRDRAIIEAFASGVPKIQIAQATGTTNPKTVRDVLRRHQDEVLALHADRYARGEGSDELVVRLAGDSLAESCRLTGWKVDDAIEAGMDSASFTVSRARDGEHALTSVTPSFAEKHGRLHPTVSWARQNSDEALSWWAGAVL